MSKESDNWLKIARYDLRAAENAYKGAIYLKVFENCHSALEKLLKGILVSRNSEARKVHDLLRLASEALVDNLQKENQQLLQELNSIYMSTRYPDDFEIIEASLDQKRAQEMLNKVKELFKWLEKKIKQN